MSRECTGALCALIVGLAACGAQAGILAGDPDAMSGWAGSVKDIYSHTSETFAVELDYAVFAPGDYGAGDPSGGEDYVYAYQAYNLSESNVAVSSLSVGTAPGAIINSAGKDSTSTHGKSGGKDPVFYQHDPDAASTTWSFSGTGFVKDTWSSVLLVTSPMGPTLDEASVIDGGNSLNFDDVPTPLPEPASMTLLALGAVAVVTRRRRA